MKDEREAKNLHRMEKQDVIDVLKMAIERVEAGKNPTVIKEHEMEKGDKESKMLDKAKKAA